MKTLTIAAIVVFSGNILNAQEHPKDTECPKAPSIKQLLPLTDEEREVLKQLDQIENRPDIVAQARAEAEVPLSAFGGCGVQQFLLTVLKLE